MDNSVYQFKSGDGITGHTVGLLAQKHPAKMKLVEHLPKVAAEAKAAVKAAREDKALSDFGKKEATKRAVDKARAVLQDFEEKTVASTKARLARLEEEGAAAWLGEVTPALQAEAQEIRSEIRRRNISDLQAGGDLMSAVESGDRAFVLAVLGAPKRFPIANAEFIGKARQMTARAARGEQIDDAEVELSVVSGVGSALRGELKKLAVDAELEVS